MQEIFKGGTTNGNDWYAVFNGMQDWLYIARGCRALTLELWSSKWPAAETLPVRGCLTTPVAPRALRLGQAPSGHMPWHDA